LKIFNKIKLKNLEKKFKSCVYMVLSLPLSVIKKVLHEAMGDEPDALRMLYYQLKNVTLPSK